MRLSAFAEIVISIILIPLFIRIRFAGSDPEKLAQFQLCSEFVSLLPFQIGMLARRIFYSRTLASCGKNPIIKMGAIFTTPDARIGDNVLIDDRCVIGFANIGDGVLLAHHVSILSGRYHHRIDSQGRVVDGRVEEITIGSNVWIGANAIVMANVGAGSVIGAGAVVVHEIGVREVAVGNPARLVKR